MSETKTSLKKDLEELVNKTIEANQLFIKESGNLFQQVAGNKGGKTATSFIQSDFFFKAINAYVSLNIQHVKNMMDLGISLTKSVARSSDNDGFPDGREDYRPGAEPAFVLQGESKAGEAIQLQFVIDNSKQTDVTCELINSPFILQDDLIENNTFKTSFTPQSFSLMPDASQSVVIDISSSKSTAPGLYISNVQVKGFEPAFFSIQVTIH